MTCLLRLRPLRATIRSVVDCRARAWMVVAVTGLAIWLPGWNRDVSTKPGGCSQARIAHDPSSAPHFARTAVIDVTAVDERSRPVMSLGSADVSVTVGGARTTVRSVRYLQRGTRDSADTRIEPAPLVVLAVDERSIGREVERAVRASLAALIDRLVDRLGPDARICVVRLPNRSNALEFTTLPAILEAEVARVRGLAEVPSELIPADVDPSICTGPECRRALEEAGSDAPRNARLHAQAVAMRDALWSHGRATLSAMEAITNALQHLPGCKTVLLLAAGLLVDGGSPDLDRLAFAAAASRVSIYGLEIIAPEWLRRFYDASFVDRLLHAVPGHPAPAAGPGALAYGRSGLSLTAERTGGALVSLGTDAATRTAALAEELAGQHAIVIDRVDVGDTGRGLSLSVKTRRPGIRIRARTVWVARDDEVDLPKTLGRARPRPVSRLAGSAPDGRALSPNQAFTRNITAAASVHRRCSSRQGDQPLSEFLVCASDAVSDFERAFSSVVAEERLEQMGRVRDSSGFTYIKRRITRADMLLLEDPSGDGWLPFRDVFEVDGTPLRDREQRLRRLFIERPAGAMEQARAITEESARFNLGSIRRTINVPTLPLLVLKRAVAPRFSFSDAGEEPLGGIRTRKIEFSERVRPTLVRDYRGSDMPSSGTFWIEPNSGCVVASRLDISAGQLQMSALVTYTPEAVSGLWVPAEMREHYRLGIDAADFINTLASYANFRRFRVFTSESVGALPRD